MKKILFTLATMAIKSWLTAPSASAAAQGTTGRWQVNTSYLQELAGAYAWISFFGIFFTMFFVSGLTLLIYSIAQSFDAIGVFAAGAVFYSGLIICLASALGLGICYRKAANHRPDFAKIYYFEAAQPEGRRGEFDLLRSAAPVLSSLLSLWTNRPGPRQAPSPAQNAAREDFSAAQARAS